MANYQIIVDSGSDLPVSELTRLDVKMASLSLLFRGQTLEDSVTDDTKEFYAAMRAGEAASTSAINPEGWTRVMEPELQAGKDLLVIAFSSGLSTTYQSAMIAADELREKYPQRQIRVVDSLCASLGGGLLVWHACRKRDAGMDLEELTAWVETNKWHLCHWFTVDDLKYLKRGGRISAATALLGTMLNIKPVLHVDDEGHLVSVSKSRGRKASIEALAQQMEKLSAFGENEAAFICHGDCLEDANYLARQIKERCGVKQVFIGYTGAVIGAHSGPGTLALFFLGKHR
ncbi:MAG: DegV family protein [Ruminococcaceae bacterium]|nr:DegV family protein [Oscillospiraceae bacterium]